MYAVIKTGARQQKVTKGDIITTDDIDKAVGDRVTFDEVFMINDKSPVIGTPLVKGAKVEGVVKETFKADKVLVFKYKKKKNYKKLRGHRQPYAKVEIEKIST